MKHHKVNLICPHCQANLTGAFAAETDNPPVPRALTICDECGNISIFAKDLTLEILTLDDLEAHMKHNSKGLLLLQRMQQFIWNRKHQET